MLALNAGACCTTACSGQAAFERLGHGSLFMCLRLGWSTSRKDKARKLQQLQAELLTLEDDINAVAGRKAQALHPDEAALSVAAADGAEPGSGSYPAVLAGLPAPQMPAELLHARLEENGDHQPPSPQSGALPALHQSGPLHSTCTRTQLEWLATPRASLIRCCGTIFCRGVQSRQKFVLWCGWQACVA